MSTHKKPTIENQQTDCFTSRSAGFHQRLLNYHCMKNSLVSPNKQTVREKLLKSSRGERMNCEVHSGLLQDFKKSKQSVKTYNYEQ